MMSRRGLCQADSLGMFLDISTLDVNEVLQHRPGESHPLQDVVAAASLHDVTQAVRPRRALLVYVGHHILILHIGQNHLGVVVEKVHLRQKNK